MTVGFALSNHSWVHGFMGSSGWDAVGAAVARRHGAVFVPGGPCYDSRHRGFDGLHMNATEHQVIATRLRLLAPARLRQDLGTGRTRIGQLVLLSSHSRGAPGWMKRLWWCGRQGDWFCLGVSEPVTEFDRRPFEHPLLSPGTVAGQLRSASVLEHVR